MGLKITRKLQKIFASLAGPSEIGKFGSFAAGLPATTTDPDQIQTANYLGGWVSGIVGSNAPAIEDVNALDFLFARQLAYLFQNGIAEWQTDTEYFIGSMVTSGLNFYVSVVDNNLSNLVTDTTKWQLRSPMTAVGDLIYGGAGGKETRLAAGADGQALTLAAGIPSWVQTVPAGTLSGFAGAAAPAGYLLCDGSSVLRATYPNLFAAIGVTWGSVDGTHFNLPDGRERTLIGATPDALGTTLGERTHVLTLAEAPAHEHLTRTGLSSGYTAPNTFGVGGTGSAPDGTLTTPGADLLKSTGAASNAIRTNSQGGGAANNNMQPSFVGNWIIKY